MEIDLKASPVRLIDRFSRNVRQEVDAPKLLRTRCRENDEFDFRCARSGNQIKVPPKPRDVLIEPAWRGSRPEADQLRLPVAD